MISKTFQKSLEEFEWFSPLENFFKSPNWLKLSSFIVEEYKTKTIYPPKGLVFQALKLKLSDVKVVIIGQDPYHGPSQANGLAFAVNTGNVFPPSLRNILKEVESNCGKSLDCDGTLLGWQDQGVMLLNTALTVVHGQASSHSKAGWGEVTDLIIKTVSDQQPRVVFLLWGAAAKAKRPLIDDTKHAIIESGHPSPLSCRLFFGTEPFKKANEVLKRYGIKEIDWARTNRG